MGSRGPGRDPEVDCTPTIHLRGLGPGLLPLSSLGTDCGLKLWVGGAGRRCCQEPPPLDLGSGSAHSASLLLPSVVPKGASAEGTQGPEKVFGF